MEHETTAAETVRPQSNMRLVAVAATALVLLAISIPFVWQTPEAAAPVAAQQGTVAPVASHETAGADTGACMRATRPNSNRRGGDGNPEGACAGAAAGDREGHSAATRMASRCSPLRRRSR